MKEKNLSSKPQQVYTCVPWPKLGHMQGESEENKESRIFSFYVGRWRLWHHPRGMHCTLVSCHQTSPKSKSLCKLLHLLSSLYLVMTPAIFLSLLWRPPILWGSFLSPNSHNQSVSCLKDHPSLHRESLLSLFSFFCSNTQMLITSQQD